MRYKGLDLHVRLYKNRHHHILHNKAYHPHILFDLPAALGSTAVSDYPNTILENDPTPITIIPHDFEVEALDYRLNFSTTEQQKYGLGTGEREVLFLCIKNEAV